MSVENIKIRDNKNLNADRDPSVDLPLESNEKSVDMLNSLLANEYTLFTKTLNFHWNVTGPRFHSLHNFLEEQYKELLGYMDEIAERVRILGSRPISTVIEMEQESHISEKPMEYPKSEEMLRVLLLDNQSIQRQIKIFLQNNSSLKNDPGTEDFLVGLLQKHEMTSWKLKSHLQ